MALLAALEHRQKTGEGQYVDIAQYEASLHFLAPSLLDYTANGNTGTRAGNRSPFTAPSGIYRCSGDDRWCAIEVRNDREWQSLGKAIGSPGWTSEPRFATMIGRVENAAQLDARLEQWTVSYSAEEVMRRLQAHGVPAMRVANSRDLHEDPQLNQTGHFQVLHHPEMGETTYDAPAFTLHGTPARLRPAPCLGEHTEYVCTSLLGMTDEEFLALTAEGVFT